MGRRRYLPGSEAVKLSTGDREVLERCYRASNKSVDALRDELLRRIAESRREDIEVSEARRDAVRLELSGRIDDEYAARLAFGRWVSDEIARLEREIADERAARKAADAATFTAWLRRTWAAIVAFCRTPVRG